MRRVMTLKWVPGGEPRGPMVKLDDRKGLFHAWATESDETSSGPVHGAVAIIEFEGGLVDTWPAHMVRFLDEQEVSGGK